MDQESTREIHVRLLDEGTDCSRPTRGVSLGQGLFKLLPTDNYNPEDEHWEFVPGSVVFVKEVLDEKGAYLLAVTREDKVGWVTMEPSDKTTEVASSPRQKRTVGWWLLSSSSF